MSAGHRWRRGALAAGTTVPVIIALATSAGSASGAGAHRTEFGGLPGLARAQATTSSAGGESQELIDRAEQYAQMRTAPGTSVSSLAFAAARRQAAAMPKVGAQWREVTSGTLQNDTRNYRDPFWSNSGSGWGITSGRTTALAVDGSEVWLGAADGGVWHSTDQGRQWTPVFDQQDKLSIGAVAINPADHSVWVGTGEANTNADAYNGTGIFRSTDQGKTWRLVGNRLDQYLVSHISFDGRGYVYASTSRGLLKRSAIDVTSNWDVVLRPDPNMPRSPYRTNITNDVKVRPGTNGREVVVSLGWRGGTLPSDTKYNGFYASRDGGNHFSRLTLTGDLAGARDIGRSTFAYSRKGERLYVVVESTATVALKGVYVSASGNAAGPWRLIADSDELNKTGSTYGNVGAQAWYNQDIAVDPNDPKHVYLDLEEVFETLDAGQDWDVIGYYWNFGRPCYQGGLSDCPMTTHPDQHAIALDQRTGIGYFGNDGGVYSRKIDNHRDSGWMNLNRDLRTLQYYYAGIGEVAGGDAIWGGTQDNGVTLKLPGTDRMVGPMGGDGGDMIVDPRNGNRAVGEYVYLNMHSTTNAGRTDGSHRAVRTISPSCFNVEFEVDPCDPNPRFIAPFEADKKNVQHWVAGGQYIWDNQGKGWRTECTDARCDWKKVHDTGDGNQTTALDVAGNVTYAGWCGTGNGCNPGSGIPFNSGIDTNYGGSWHTVDAPNLPNRLVTDIWVDPTDARHVIAAFGAFSRHWIPAAGTGHVFESRNGGGSWTDISGNLPDIPASSLSTWRGHLVVGTDIGAFVMTGQRQYAVLGGNLPNAAVYDLVKSPRGDYLLAATHGRGMWKLID
jgi:hypothetical protein